MLGQQQSRHLKRCLRFLFSIGLIALLPGAFVYGKDPILAPVFTAQPFQLGSSTAPLTFATAIQGGGSSTNILFSQGEQTQPSIGGPGLKPQTAVFATFADPNGQVLATLSTRLTRNSTQSLTFGGGSNLEAGQISIRALDPLSGVPLGLREAKVTVTAIINLLIPGTGGTVPPIGLPPSLSCANPVVSLLRNEEFDTGVALASANAVDTLCEWNLYSGEAGTKVGEGATFIRPFGQSQLFPLNDSSVAADVQNSNFSGNIQYHCNHPVQSLSLFQRRSDGAIFFNATACFD